MKKDEKAVAVAELHEKFSRARLAIMTECSGVPVNQITELRKQLRAANAEFKVIKNTMATRAVEGTLLAAAKPYFKGPLAITIGYDDPIVPTKILRDFIRAEKREEKIKMLVGVVEGKLLEAAQLVTVASLPTRSALLAMLLSAMQGPVRGLAFALSGLVRGLVGVIIAIQDKKKGEGDMPTTEGKLSQEEFIKAIENMSVLELAELVKGLEARFGVTAAAPVAGTTAPASGGPPAAVEEKTAFEVVLASAVAEKKIQVIKTVRELTSLGLKEAKDLVEGAPKPVKTGVTKEEAETMKKRLEESGAKVEIR